jgi:hypothetical protein
MWDMDGILNFSPRRPELEWQYGGFPDFPPDILFTDFSVSLSIEFLHKSTQILSVHRILPTF